MKKENLKKLFTVILGAAAIFPCAAAVKELLKEKDIKKTTAAKSTKEAVHAERF